MNEPLVTVICVSYNHATFITEALDSIVNQSYKNIELIVIDDGSADGSGKIIKRWVANHPQTVMLLNGTNQGYCKSFNKALKLAKGDFIIDLAGDDLLMPDCVTDGIELFKTKDQNCGVIFSDAEYIDESGKFLHLHSEKFPHQTIPQGNIYKDLIQRYFICSPTMMIRSEVLTALNGFDESLAYEDFDLWIRASRNYEFYYLPKPRIKKRLVNTSLSSRQFRKGDTQRWSTMQVCKKIKMLNRTETENAALRKRLFYEIGISVRMGDFRLALEFGKILFV